MPQQLDRSLAKQKLCCHPVPGSEGRTPCRSQTEHDCLHTVARTPCCNLERSFHLQELIHCKCSTHMVIWVVWLQAQSGRWPQLCCQLLPQSIVVTCRSSVCRFAQQSVLACTVSAFYLAVETQDSPVARQSRHTCRANSLQPCGPNALVRINISHLSYLSS